MKAVLPWMALLLGIGLPLLGARQESKPVDSSPGWSATPDVLMVAAGSQPATAPSALLDPRLIKTNLALGPIHKESRQVHFSNRPSKYVLLRSYNDGWELWDLKLGAKEKEGHGKLPIREGVLSPDGQYIAGHTDTNRIEVWSLRKGVKVTAVEDKELRDVLGYSINNGLVVSMMGSKPTVNVYDMATGNLRFSMPADWAHDRKACAISANGRYLASCGIKLALFDLAEGKLLGEVEKVTSNRIPAFSPDGREIACVYGGQREASIEVHDMATGRLLGSARTELAQPRCDFERLEYSPDGRFLLATGEYEFIFDRATLVPVMRPPMHEKLLYARWADNDNILQIYEALKYRVVFEGIPMPRATLVKAAAQIADGANVEDNHLVPATKVSTEGAVTVAFNTGAATPWRVRPETTPPSTMPAAPFQVKPAPPLPRLNDTPDYRLLGKEDEPAAMFFTSSQANSLFFVHVQKENGTRVHDPRDWEETFIERHDLSGRLTASFSAGRLMQAMDASPSGKSIVFRSGIGCDRVEIWSEDKAAFKPVVAFRPFGPVKPTLELLVEINHIRRRNLNCVTWAELVDDTHVLVGGAGNEAALFEFPAPKLLWRGMTTTRGLGARLRPSLSPDRKLAAVAVPGGLIIFETLTGKVLNTIDQEGVYDSEAPTFSPDGRSLGYVSRRKGYGALHVIDLATGNVLYDFPVERQLPGEMWFVSPGYVMLDRSLYSLEKRGEICRYSVDHFLNFQFGSAKPFDRFFYVLGAHPTLKPPVPMTVASVQPPHAEAKKAEETLDVDDLYAWRPGMKVSLSLGVVGDEEFRKAQVVEWTNRLKELGFEVSGDAPDQLKVTNYVVSGPSVQATVFTKGQEQASVHTEIAACDVSLTVGGKEIWKSGNAMTPPPPNTRIVGAMGDTTQQAIERFYPPVKKSSIIMLPPAYILKDHKVETAKLGPGGVEVPGAGNPGPGGKPAKRVVR